MRVVFMGVASHRTIQAYSVWTIAHLTVPSPTTAGPCTGLGTQEIVTPYRNPCTFPMRKKYTKNV